jgi:UDP-N-acetylmuramoylalanine--D-glutamate ligase
MYEKVKGVYIHNGKVYSNLTKKIEKIVDLDELAEFSGVLHDVLASILVGLLLKIDKEKILEAIKEFQLSPHRLQVINKYNNITFVDDSKSTNIHSTINGLTTVKNQVVLLLGGEDKNLNFAPIFENFREKLDMVVAFGSARNKIVRTAKKCNFDKIKTAKHFVDGVMIACESAIDNNIVLLSPACCSFDEFESYAERGNVFSKVVAKYIDAKN